MALGSTQPLIEQAACV